MENKGYIWKDISQGIHNLQHLEQHTAWGTTLNMLEKTPKLISTILHDNNSISAGETHLHNDNPNHAEISSDLYFILT